MALLSGLATLVATAALAAPPIVTPGDAVRPEKGVDHDVLMVLTDAAARRTVGVMDSEEVLLTRYAGPRDEPHHVLLDPDTGERTEVPVMSPSTSVLQATDDRVLLGGPVQDRRITAFTWDRAAGTTEEFRLPDAGRNPRVLDVEGDRVWFRTGPRTEHTTEDPVWTVLLGDNASLTKVGRFSGPAVDAGTLVHRVEPSTTDEPEAVAFRDLVTGETTTPPLPRRCVIEAPSGALQTNGAQVSADTYCGRHEPTFVLDRTGVLVELRVESDEGNLGTSDRTVALLGHVYDLATGRLLDVTGRRATPGLAPSAGPGANPMMTWPRGRDEHDEPTRVLVVRLR